MKTLEYSLEISYCSDININIGWLDKDKDLELLLPLLREKIKDHLLGRAINRQEAKHIVRSIIDSFIFYLLQTGYVCEFDSRWHVNIVGLITDIIKNEALSDHDKSIYAECLIEKKSETLELCDQVKKSSAEVIEWLGKELNDEKLNEAIGNYENELICRIININKD